MDSWNLVCQWFPGVQTSPVRGLIPLSLVRGPISLYFPLSALMLHCVDKTANTEQFVCFALVPVSVAMSLLVLTDNKTLNFVRSQADLYMRTDTDSIEFEYSDSYPRSGARLFWWLLWLHLLQFQLQYSHNATTSQLAQTWNFWHYCSLALWNHSTTYRDLPCKLLATDSRYSRVNFLYPTFSLSLYSLNLSSVQSIVSIYTVSHQRNILSSTVPHVTLRDKRCTVFPAARNYSV